MPTHLIGHSPRKCRFRRRNRQASEPHMCTAASIPGAKSPVARNSEEEARGEDGSFGGGDTPPSGLSSTPGRACAGVSATGTGRKRPRERLRPADSGPQWTAWSADPARVRLVDGHPNAGVRRVRAAALRRDVVAVVLVVAGVVEDGARELDSKSIDVHVAVVRLVVGWTRGLPSVTRWSRWTTRLARGASSEG